MLNSTRINAASVQAAVRYFGHVIRADGMKPDPEKLRAIEEMPRPQSREELLTLLGMLNYLAKYFPDLSTRNKSLRDILKCEPFSWSPEMTRRW